MTLRVLLVDDDTTYWTLIQSLLEIEPRLGLVDMSRLSDGDELVAYLKREPPYDEPTGM